MKRVISVLLLCLLLTVSGCGDRRPVDLLAVIAHLSIDQAEGEAGNLEVVAFRPLFEPTKQQFAHILTADSRTFAGAMLSMERIENKRLVTGKVRTVFFGRALAEEGIFELLREFDQISDFNSGVILAVVDGRSSDIARFHPPENQRVGFHVSEAMEQAIVRQIVPTVTFAEFMRTAASTETENVLPIVRYRLGEHHEMEIDGLAVFRGGKMVGRLVNSETIPYWLLTKRVREVPLEVTAEDLADSPFRALSFNLRGKRLRVSTSLDGDTPVIRIDLQVTLDLNSYIPKDLTEGQEYQRPEMDDALLQETEKFLSEYLTGLVLKSVRKCQDEFQADIFGFCERMRVQNFDYYQEHDWAEEFPRAEVKCETSVRVRTFEALFF